MFKNEEEIRVMSEKKKLVLETKNLIYEIFFKKKDLNLKQGDYKLL